MNGVIEGTQILTPNGPVLVERLIPGDYVLSASEHGEIVAVTIKSVLVSDYTGPIRTFCTDRNQCLSVTPGHVLFVDVAAGAPADLWAQVGREVLTDEDIQKRLKQWREFDVCADPLFPDHDFERLIRTKSRSGTVWLGASYWGDEEEGRTPEGYVTNPPIVFESYAEEPGPKREHIVRWGRHIRDFDFVWKTTVEEQKQRGLEDVRLEMYFGDWPELQDPVTTYTSLPANLLTPWHFVPTADDRQHDDGLLHIRSARVCDILDDDHTGRVYDLSVNPLCNYLAAGIVVFSAREQE